MQRPRLALVPGEPAGVGPELCARALQRAWDAELVVHGDGDALLTAAERLGITLERPAHDTLVAAGGRFRLIDVPGACVVAPGRPVAANAPAVVAALSSAADACLRGDCDGMVTGPVHKATINHGGIAYTGTTGLLAAHAGCEVVMMLANDHMRVALATVHLPLRAVADALTPTLLERSLRIVHAALRDDFAIADPVIAVLGLNPHAGEEGHLGREELDVIIPVLTRLRSEGLRLEGPLPADTAFLPRKLAGVDAVLAMYHDQGLPVLKYSGFEQAVNISLGLPYPRVAVDHGTAFDLAGSGRADPSSLFAAIEACTRLASARRATHDALHADRLA
ncbi:4-hydroxythreonine-4-phosphate dehydrogenase PdxA [Luteimonas sp. MC1572]|uniref:4-hydroxythreonine-4-phosphate dehydrogenase PdxA n=1 Tax=Luteimonas sp. MC1572 TaxID=2799325 RepID=UPI0018F0C422|nr:4-hydroxythreonine-4-phosphate dehydrogenase PdxA [Luteimonas sp. MC1572]MBJ6981273.1 4-hydroxythreonine-4-phosphate dehydrogenase PdxA [Luteimonas sp. MC1572]QQO02596.1 4-hydroxythreonine-4-phosphate dehydrogenase PdxA [Luteimonas sp. MC1572]